MTRATQAIPGRTESAIDADLERRVLQFADECEAHGFPVTRHFQVEAAAAAELIGVKPETMKQWRKYGRGDDPGPPWHKYGALPWDDPGSGRAWYPIRALLEWIARKGR